MEPLLNKNESMPNSEVLNSNSELQTINPNKAKNPEAEDSSKIDIINQQIEQALVTQNSPNEIPKELPKVINDTQTNPDAVKIPTLSTPDTAEDTDVIKKEWVKAAENIIENTKNNPHERDNQVTGLREVYKQKRYPNKSNKATQ